MQVLDDDRHPDGRNPMTSAGAAYAMIAPSRDVVRPVGSWNEARIVAKGKKISFWLNGVNVVNYEVGSPEWNALKAKSKFSGMPRYSLPMSGHIVLQDHGDVVSYRSIRIKRL